MGGAVCEEEMPEQISGLGSIIRAEEPRSDTGFGTVRTDMPMSHRDLAPRGFLG